MPVEQAAVNTFALSSFPKYTLAMCEVLPKFNRSVSWLCWAYNEEESIREYLIRANELLKKTVEDYEIILVDDGSTDRTYAIAEDLKKKMPEIRLFRNASNRDVGFSSQRAIMSASKEFLFWQTADWAYDIRCLRVFLELLKSHDVVAGVRRGPGNNLFRPLRGGRSDTLPKAVVSVVNYLLIRFLFRVPLGDFQNVVFYPASLIQSIVYESDSSFANPEGLIKAFWKGASIAEVPISFLPRQSGKSKGTRLKAVAASVRDIFRLWFKWVVLGRRSQCRKGIIHRLRVEEWEKL